MSPTDPGPTVYILVRKSSDDPSADTGAVLSAYADADLARHIQRILANNYVESIIVRLPLIGWQMLATEGGAIKAEDVSVATHNPQRRLD